MPRKTPPPPAPNSLEEWFVQRNPELKLANFQRILMLELERLAGRETALRNLLTAMPPGHAKTTLGTFSFVPWYLSRNPTHNVLLLSYDDPRGRRFGRKVRNICRIEAEEGRYPGLRPTHDSSANNYFNTEQGNEVFAGGFNSPLAGDRVDLVDLDDPIKSMVEARSEARMEEIWDIYKSVVVPRLKPGGIIVAHVTRFGMRDFVARLLEHEGARWKQLIFPAEQPAESGRFLWPQYIGKDAYERAKADPETWWSVWQQQPKQLRSHVFKPEWLLYWDPTGWVPPAPAEHVVPQVLT